MIVFEHLSGHIARATTSLVTWSNFFTWKTDRHSVLYTAQWLRQLRIFPMFARIAYFYKLWNNTSYLIFSLILKCLAGINCCVTISTSVEQYGKAKIRKKKLDLVCIFEIFHRQIWCSPHAHEQWHLWRQFIRDFAFTSEFLAGKFVMFEEDAGLLRVIEGHFCSQIPVYFTF